MKASLLYKEFLLIKTRPGMYIGRKSVTVLFHYYLGFRMALRAAKVKDKQYPPFDLFDPWLRSQLRSKLILQSISWAEILRRLSNDEKGLDDFYQYFDHFLKLKITSLEMIQDEEQTKCLQAYWGDGKFKTLYRLDKKKKIIGSFVFPHKMEVDLISFIKANWVHGELNRACKVPRTETQAWIKKIIEFHGQEKN